MCTLPVCRRRGRELLVSVLGDVLLELGLWWKKGAG